MRDWMLPLISSAIIVVIQIVFAPILTIFSVVPSFIVAFSLVLAIMRRPDSTYAYAFVLGLIADLFAQTPVGLTSLLLLVATFVLSRAFEVLDDTTLTMPLIALAATLFVFELLFAIVLMVVGYQGSFIEIFLQRVLPSTVLNALIAALLFVIMRRLPFTQAVNDAWKVSDSGRYR
ncbi:MAG: rod shape-determining protein MreD [Eggerthellaceae bacterium]